MWKDKNEISQLILWKSPTPILRSKDNQAMKFGQLIEYNVGNIFLEKSYTNYSQALFWKVKAELW